MFSPGYYVDPEKARVERDGYEWRYAISFDKDEDENGDCPYCEVEHYIDSNDTRIRLKK